MIPLVGFVSGVLTEMRRYDDAAPDVEYLLESFPLDPDIVMSVAGENAMTPSISRNPASRTQADNISARLPPAESPET